MPMFGNIGIWNPPEMGVSARYVILTVQHLPSARFYCAC